MDNKSYTEISVDDYEKTISKIDSMTTEEELIDSHKRMIGKTCKCDYYEIEDCGVEFIKKFLDRDWGRSIVYHYSQGAERFIKSKYLSDYFKSSIKELLSSEYIDDDVLNILNSDKLINDMSAEEISKIYSLIRNYYKKSEQKTANVARSIMSFLYKLNGKGVISFIKNNVNNLDIARNILQTSGLSARASFYSGRGVNYGDLNEEHLTAIFVKLLKLDQSYAIEFAKMVEQMETVGATEFISSFMDFAAVGFKSNHIINEYSNISLDELYDQARDTVAFASLFSTMYREIDIDYQIRVSEEIKQSFISKITPILLQQNKEVANDYNQYYNNYGNPNTKRR